MPLQFRTTFHLALTILTKLLLDLLLSLKILNPAAVHDHGDYDSALDAMGLVYILLIVIFTFELLRLLINAYRLILKMSHAIRIHFRDDQFVYRPRPQPQQTQSRNTVPGVNINVNTPFD
jgi:hypothetical protein